MKFPYLRYLSVAAGTKQEILRPVVPVDLAGPEGEIDYYGLVDSGSDDTLIPRLLARELGLAVDDSQQSKVVGIGGEIVVVSSANLELRIAREGRFYSWDATVGVVGVKEDEHDFVILGHSGFLEFFVATFDGQQKTLELLTTDSFPGIAGDVNGPPA